MLCQKQIVAGGRQPVDRIREFVEKGDQNVAASSKSPSEKKLSGNSVL
jgi:hypothetical protein